MAAGGGGEKEGGGGAGRSTAMAEVMGGVGDGTEEGGKVEG